MKFPDQMGQRENIVRGVQKAIAGSVEVKVKVKAKMKRPWEASNRTKTIFNGCLVARVAGAVGRACLFGNPVA